MNTINMIIALIIIMGTIYNDIYKGNKLKNYKNDERWQAIQSKADKIMNKYYIFLMVIATIGALTMQGICFNLGHAFGYAFIALSSRYILEVFVLKFYDSKM